MMSRTITYSNTMSDLCSVPVCEGTNEVEDQPETVAEAQLRILKQRKFCDVTFTFPNLPDRIEAHEYFLKARSPVFEETFAKCKFRNVDDRQIEINGSTPKRFQQFLEFIYADKFDTDVAGALDLLHLALKYQVEPLMTKCEELLKADIKVKHCVRIFEAADRCGLIELKEKAWNFMLKSFGQVVDSGALANAEEQTVMSLLECDDLNIKEVKLFQSILEWGKHQIAPSEDDQYLKKILKKLVKMIRYTNMTPLEVTTVVEPTWLLSSEELLSVYKYLCGDETTRMNVKIKFNTAPRRVVPAMVLPSREKPTWM